MTPDLAKLRALVAALREPMPSGFEWDMTTGHNVTDCGSVGCAIGLGIVRGIISAMRPGWWLDLGISTEERTRLFYPGESHLHADGLDPHTPYDDITPAIQAHRIERFIHEIEDAQASGGPA